MAGPFKIVIADTAAKIDPQAREKAFNWAGDRVQLETQSDGVQVAQQVAGSGAFEVPSGTSPQAMVSLVYGSRNARTPYFWRIISGGGGDVATPGKEHTVEISNRLRLSLWAFVPPLTTGKVLSDSLEMDSGSIGLLKNAEVDDLSLVWTVTWDPRAKADDPAKPPKWHNGFMPRGQSTEKYRKNYLRDLIAALHPKVQVVVGYEIVRKTAKKESAAAREKRLSKLSADDRRKAESKEAKDAVDDAVLKTLSLDFAAWLRAASAGDIRKYAQSIVEFFSSRDLDIDGVGFDFEFDGLNRDHATNLALLYRETSDAIAHRNGIVSYANAPFAEDGVNSNAFMLPQPFAIAATGHNLLARPMCFDGSNSSSLGVITGAIACALRSPADRTKPGGAGLHPSQVQFGIWTDKVGDAVKLCTDVLRPNRIGLLVYNLPPNAADAEPLLKRCQAFNAALNPGEGPAGEPGKPLQVPRGFGGWPPPFKEKT